MSFFKRLHGKAKQDTPGQRQGRSEEEPILQAADGGVSPRLYASGELIDSRFEVVKFLTGGMGVVYLCVDQQDSTPVALKRDRGSASRM